MDVPHQLQTLLQFLVTDASSITHLAYILDHLSSSCLAPSPHLQKWVTRVTSLMHSKDPAARWAAICIVYRMSFLSKPLLVENAQSWVGIIFPSLSRAEPAPVLKASMRYLTLVLCAASHNLEFQRQVAIPIVPKVSSAVLAIAENHNDQDIKISSIRMLAQLVPMYPSLHKALSQRLFALCRRIFSGSMQHTTESILDATVHLYAVLHSLGGKAGGIHLWRSCLDEVLQFSWSSWLTLRTTFPTSARHKATPYLSSPNDNLSDTPLHADAMAGNPLTTVALNLDRLKCGISAIRTLLRVPVSRPVRVPTGHLATLCWCLLTCTRDDEGQAHFDPHVRSAESAVVPQIWTQGCRLLSCLAQTTQELFAPHVSKLLMIISSHLEGNLESPQRHSFIRCAYHLLYFCPVVGATLAVNRLLKVTISLLSPLYLLQPRTEPNPGASSQTRASKKRRREYEADNVLSTFNSTLRTRMDESDTLITALDVVDQCMQNVELTPSTRSLVNRVLLSMLLSLPSMPSSSLSTDPSFHGRVLEKVRSMCAENVHGASHAMSRGTSLVLRTFSSKGLAARDKLHSHVDLLLHPRRPPLVRTLPIVESLSLTSAEESPEESATRQSLNMTFGSGEMRSITSEPQTHPGSVVHSTWAVDQQVPPNPSVEESYPQATTDTGNLLVEPTPPAAPIAMPSQAMPDLPTESRTPLLPKGPASNVYVAPMLVDESDHEEVPTIDLGSDSDD